MIGFRRFLLTAALLFSVEYMFPQTFNAAELFIVSETNDKKNSLDEVTISTPRFYNTPKGKRIKMQVCNKGNSDIRRLRFILYHANGNKKECINKTWVSPLRAAECYSFCVNINYKLDNDDKKDLVFRLQRGKSYKDYRFKDDFNAPNED